MKLWYNFYVRDIGKIEAHFNGISSKYWKRIYKMNVTIPRNLLWNNSRYVPIPPHLSFYLCGKKYIFIDRYNFILGVHVSIN